jgi:hypothetical protein
VTAAGRGAGHNTGPAALVAARLAEQLARAGTVFRLDADVVERELAHPVEPDGLAQGSVTATIPNRSTGLSQVRHRHATLDDDRVDLLLRPPVARLGGLDFRGGVALIEAGHQYAVEALAKSGLPP